MGRWALLPVTRPFAGALVIEGDPDRGLEQIVQQANVQVVEIPVASGAPDAATMSPLAEIRAALRRPCAELSKGWGGAQRISTARKTAGASRGASILPRPLTIAGTSISPRPSLRPDNVVPRSMSGAERPTDANAFVGHDGDGTANQLKIHRRQKLFRQRFVALPALVIESQKDNARRSFSLLHTANVCQPLICRDQKAMLGADSGPNLGVCPSSPSLLGDGRDVVTSGT